MDFGQKQYSTSLEEILASMGENGDRRVTWEFDQSLRALRALVEKELGTGDISRIIWELRIWRELEDEGWTDAIPTGRAWKTQRRGSAHLGFHEDRTKSEYLGTRATNNDGKLSGIAQALEGAREVSMLAIRGPGLRHGHRPYANNIDSQNFFFSCTLGRHCRLWKKNQVSVPVTA